MKESIWNKQFERKHVPYLIITILAILMLIYFDLLHDSFQIKFGQSIDIKQLHASHMFQEIQDKDIILVGEAHGTDKNYIFLSSLLEEVNQIDYLGLEMCMAQAYFWNKYILNDNEDAYRLALVSSANTPLASKEFVMFIQSIKQVNANRDKPMLIIGLDGEFANGIITAICLYDILQKYNPDLIDPQIHKIISRPMTANSANTIQTFFSEHLKSILNQEDMLYVELILSQKYSDEDVMQNLHIRDEKMYEIFTKVDAYQQGKWLINLGKAHTISYEANNKQSFGRILDNQTSLNKYSIVLNYIYSEAFFDRETSLLMTIPYNTLVKTDGDKVFLNNQSNKYPYRFLKKKYGITNENIPNAIIVLNESKAVTMEEFY